MTKQETVEIVTLIVAAYPAAERLKDENTITAMVNVWAKVFKDDNPRLVELAVQKHITTNKWAPNIAEIREQMAALEHPEIIPPDVAWAAVSELLNLSGFFNSSLPKLPRLVERCVEIIGWDYLKEMHRGQFGGYKPGMDRLTFIQQYTPMYEREREKAMLPKTIFEAVRKAKAANGSETYKLLDEIHQMYLDDKKQWELTISIASEKQLENREQKLLGGNEDV